MNALVTSCVLVVLLGLTFAEKDINCNGLKPRPDFDNDKVSNGFWFETFTSSYEYTSACVNLFIQYSETNISTLLTVKAKDDGKIKYWKSVLKATDTKGMYEGPEGKHALIWKTDYENYYVFIMCASDDDTNVPPQRIITFATRSEKGEINPVAQKAFDATRAEMQSLKIDTDVLKAVDFTDCPVPNAGEAKRIMSRMEPTIKPVEVSDDILKP